ncbi:membrane protein [Salmonella enterica subsp. enterica]|uniref:Membrane protein n=1 Tax=Salmonella enterica I TaxID=59201 RepID=A0A447MSZ8_SALET|nr:membrane protein [Salmonella enterica subsp. enterica]VEA12321.1 membrane protein [Salmonella enterica subsp. enterica]
MSRTTILDDATASDIDEQRHSQPVQFIKRGTAPFMRVTLALFSAGLATFALLYCVQPILPVLSQEFGVSPRQQQRFTFYFYRHAGYRLTFYRPAF